MAELYATDPLVIDSTTVLSLLTTVCILLTSYLLSLRLLPLGSPIKIRVLFVWHSFDSLIHILLEGSFLYNCFFVSIPFDSPHASVSHPAAWPQNPEGVLSLTPPGVHFLGDARRMYGSAYAGNGNPMAALWREYAKADRRWAGADLTVVSLETLTVFLGGPIAAWICYLCTRTGRQGSNKAMLGTDISKSLTGPGRVWIWAGWLACGELYGGYMTFAPEWLSGNTNLNTSNWMYMWVYLVFFNMLWVVMPFWVLGQGYREISRAFDAAEALEGDHQSRKNQ